MARYRLRFLLQEFDLVGPEVILGRSPDCHITIEDPLVSRRHARIRVASGDASIADLGSRNGVRINGQKIDVEHTLADGDRIRLGTQELVFSAVSTAKREARPTGFMRVCHACGTPYPEVAPECPHCGAMTPSDEEDDTMSGLLVEPKRSWTFQLLGEVIERALATGRSSEAERLLRRAAKEVDDRVAAGDRLDPNQVAMITGFALRLADLADQAEWIRWAFKVHRDQILMPSAPVLEALEKLDRSAIPELPQIAEEFSSWWRTHAGSEPTADLAGLARLEALTGDSGGDDS